MTLPSAMALTSSNAPRRRRAAGQGGRRHGRRRHPAGARLLSTGVLARVAATTVLAALTLFASCTTADTGGGSADDAANGGGPVDGATNGGGSAGTTGAAPSTPARNDQAAAVEQEIEVGKSVVAKLTGQYGLVQDSDATEYLNKFVATVGLFVSRQELTFRAGILETEQVNAFALPGGYMLFTLGVLQQVDSPSALAGVIAHELGHTDLRHILEQVQIEVEYSVVETLARLLAGPRQVITQAVDQINAEIEERLFLEGYARDDEYDADEYAVRLLQSLGIDARPYRDYLATLAESSDAELDNLDQTHPPLSERVARIDELLVPGLEPLPITEEFRAFSDRVRAIEVFEE